MDNDDEDDIELDVIKIEEDKGRIQKKRTIMGE